MTKDNEAGGGATPPAAESDGLNFKTLKLAHLGARNEDGVTVVNEVEGWMHKLAELSLDERYASAGSVTLEIAVTASEDKQSVMVQPKVTVKRPKRLHMGAVGFLGNDNKIKVQHADQLELPVHRPPIRLPLRPDPTND